MHGSGTFSVDYFQLSTDQSLILCIASMKCSMGTDALHKQQLEQHLAVLSNTQLQLSSPHVDSSACLHFSPAWEA
jgi:hypothetical protein